MDGKSSNVNGVVPGESIYQRKSEGGNEPLSVNNRKKRY